MNANFDEKQAFENLRDILNHIYNFANHYYAEMQKAQTLCNEKDDTITELKNQLADERYKAETRLEETIQAKDAELSAQRNDFEEKLAAQVETFNAELKESREHNEKLTKWLQNDYDDLQKRNAALKIREDTLTEKERQLRADSDTLVTASANLDEKRRDFYALKEIRETTPSDAERIRKLEKEAGELTRQKKELENQLADKEQEIEELKADNERLRNIANNADAERKGIDSAAKNTADFVQDDNFNGDLDVALMKNNFDNAPAKNFNDKPADNPSEEKWREKFV